MKIFNPTVSGSIILPTGSAPVTSSGFAYIYAKTDGKIYLTQEDGTEAEVGGGGGGGGFTFYDVTLADAENTTSETTIASCVVPANTWLDGQTIYFDLYCDIQNLSGGGVTVTASFGSSLSTALSSTIGTALSNGLEREIFMRNSITRVGTDLYIGMSMRSQTGGYGYPFDIVGLSFPSVGKDNVFVRPAGTFNSDQTISYKVQMGTANAATWYRPWNGTAYKTEKGAAL